MLRAKEKAEGKELFYRTMFNCTPVLMHTADLNGVILSVNEFWLKTLEYAAEEVLGTNSSQYLTEGSREIAMRLRPELLRNGILTNIEGQAITKSGKLIDILVGSRVVYDESGKPLQLITTLQDITERKQAEELVRLRENYLTAIIENQPGLVWLKDSDGRFLTVNHAFARSCGKTGPDELIGKTDFDVWPHELARKYRNDDAAVMRTGAPVIVEELISDNGERRWFETFKTPIKNIHGAIIGTTGYAHDITARKLEEEALSTIQKLESLGILAGGIAHDFNNLLCGIFGGIDLALTKKPEGEVWELLTKVRASLDRARGLTQQLLTFAKGGTPIKRIESLVPFVKETAQFALSGSRVSATFQIPTDLWPCEFDKNQIGQVIDNLVINAQQAMPEGGTIAINAENVTIDDTSAFKSLSPGRYVKLSVVDRGVGISPEIITKIFDPFFTTKAKGHGLGLTTCHSIVKRHGGCIDVESEVGKGSVFHVYLPAAPDAAALPQKNVVEPFNHFGAIIVMDDEEMIRLVVCGILKTLGYFAIPTKNGREAVEVLRNEKLSGKTIEAMILDLTVPGAMGGLEAIAEIRSIDPRLPVYVASGYADDPVIASPQAYGFTDSIRKPFQISELAEMLRKGAKVAPKP